MTGPNTFDPKASIRVQIEAATILDNNELGELLAQIISSKENAGKGLDQQPSTLGKTNDTASSYSLAEQPTEIQSSSTSHVTGGTTASTPATGGPTSSVNEDIITLISTDGNTGGTGGTG